MYCDRFCTLLFISAPNPHNLLSAVREIIQLREIVLWLRRRAVARLEVHWAKYSLS